MDCALANSLIRVNSTWCRSSVAAHPVARLTRFSRPTGPYGQSVRGRKICCPLNGESDMSRQRSEDISLYNILGGRIHPLLGFFLNVGALAGKVRISARATHTRRLTSSVPSSSHRALRRKRAALTSVDGARHCQGICFFSLNKIKKHN